MTFDWSVLDFGGDQSEVRGFVDFAVSTMNVIKLSKKKTSLHILFSFSLYFRGIQYCIFFVIPYLSFFSRISFILSCDLIYSFVRL